MKKTQNLTLLKKLIIITYSSIKRIFLQETQTLLALCLCGLCGVGMKLKYTNFHSDWFGSKLCLYFSTWDRHDQENVRVLLPANGTSFANGS